MADLGTKVYQSSDSSVASCETMDRVNGIKNLLVIEKDQCYCDTCIQFYDHA